MNDTTLGLELCEGSGWYDVGGGAMIDFTCDTLGIKELVIGP